MSKAMHNAAGNMAQTAVGNKHYANLLIMTVVHFGAMYMLMYAMVNSYANVYPNLNQFYMAGIMTALMIILELLLMRSMYENKVINAVAMGFGAVILVAFFLFIRNQTAISDTEFLTSMIPHHGAAILMCKRAPIEDSEIQTLIDQMKVKLAELES